MPSILIAVPFIWSGLIIGISFIEAPLKFRAPNITRELGLGIGKLVFTALNRVELILAAFTALALFFVQAESTVAILYSLPISILLFQTFLLIPVLNKRADQIIAGNTPKKTKHHIVFVVLELVKLISLLLAAFYFLSLTI